MDKRPLHGLELLLGMQHARAELNREIQTEADVQRFCPDPAGQLGAEGLLPDDIFQQDIGFVLDLFHVIGTDDVHVFFQADPGLRFPHEPFDLGLFREEDVLESLEHDGLLGLAVVTDIDDPHAALPELMNLVAASDPVTDLIAGTGDFPWFCARPRPPGVGRQVIVGFGDERLSQFFFRHGEIEKA